MKTIPPPDPVCIKDSVLVNEDTEKRLNDRIMQLEKELQYSKECLQSLHEEFMAYSDLLNSNEELKVVNDELLKIKAQYQFQNQELDIINNDMSNYISSTEIATIFLDDKLCIRKFTPGITKELNVKIRDIGRPMRDITHNLITDDLNTASDQALRGKKSIEKEIQSKDGYWYLLKCAPYYLSDNAVEGVVISLVNITRSKLAEQDVFSSKEKFDSLVENSPYSIYVVQNGKFVFSNSAGLKLLKLEHLRALVSVDYRYYFNIIEEKLTGDALPKEDSIILSDGTLLCVEISAMSHIFDGKAARLLFVRDISYRLKEMLLEEENENNLKLLQEKILSENLMKEFFGTLSHELRTPLNVIFSALQLLDATMSRGDFINSEEKILKFSKIMKQNCYRQMKLVNNMIDVTKLDTGFFNLNLKNNDIVKIVRSVSQSVSDYISAKDVELTFKTNAEICIISCDAEKIERIVLNLLSNALKFTDAGGRIILSMHVQAEDILISVRDNGIGIPNDKLDVVFDRFRQVDKSSTRNAEGIGLGLYIVKSLVEMHGGKISVLSEYGKGTEFFIILPVQSLHESNAVGESFSSDQEKRLERINTEFSDI